MSQATLLVDTSFLGDVLCAEPLVRAAVAKFDGPVDFLTSPGGAQMLCGHPDLREVMVYEKRGADKGIAGIFRLAKALRQRQYARVICSHRSWRTAFLLRLARIPERVGYDNASGAKLYTKLVPYPQGLHEIERNLALIGGGAWERPRLYPSEAEKRRALELAPQSGYVAVAPGSIWATKRWPAEHFAAAIKQLLDGGERVVLLGGPDDTDLADEIIQLSGGGPGLSNLTGKTNLRESYAVLEHAACLMTNDSAPMHMGVAAGIPVVAIFCSTVPDFGFGPRGAQDIVLQVADLDCRPCGIHGHPTCPEHHFRCGNEVSAEMVVNAVRKRLRVDVSGA
ncbi:MAG: glycosyltransferase family 9 protein [Planctomycetota bacterium]